MLKFLLAPAIVLLAQSALARDAALILGNESYDQLGRLSRGSSPVAAGEALRGMGFEVVSVPNARSGPASTAIAEFLGLVDDAERLVVVLSGRFATDGDTTWFLATNARDPAYLRLGAAAFEVEGILQVLSANPGGAILILGSDPAANEVFDPWLREGVGTLSIPQGVTVLRGAPRDVAAFIEDDLAEPRGDLAEAIASDRAISAEGFVPREFMFMGDRPDPDTSGGQTDPDAEAALWEGAVALDTVEAYQNYLTRYPGGDFAAEARSRIEAILSEPNRDARLAEEALGLDRDERREIQRDLSILDYSTRGIDGIFGPGTRGAILNWQQQNGFPQTSYLTGEQITRLDAQAARRAAELEAEAELQRQAELARDRAFWDETGARGDEPGLRAYLERYPDGLFSETAKTQLSIIEEEKRRAAEGEDRAAWDAARDTDSLQSYRAYLSAFPDGVFQSEAEARIAELNAEDDNSQAEAAARAAEEALDLNPITRTLVEAKLDQLGLNPGAVDGRFTDQTRSALRNYQRDRGLPVTGYLNEPTMVRLLADTIGQRRN